jgi:hypothetical protein
MAKRVASDPPVQIDIQIERWPVERLIPRANNPRTHSRAQVASIAASMREWGWTNPILVGADDEVLAELRRNSDFRSIGVAHKNGISCYLVRRYPPLTMIL